MFRDTKNRISRCGKFPASREFLAFPLLVNDLDKGVGTLARTAIGIGKNNRQKGF
jgi:hypothetical protein